MHWHEHVAAIEAILAALTISPDSITLGERRLEAASRSDRIAALSRLLYEEAFIKGIDEREPPRCAGRDVAGFVAQLSASNFGNGRRSEGWRLVELAGDRYAVVEKDGQRYRVGRELVSERYGAVKLHVPKEDLLSSEAFYYAYGDALPLGARPALTRFYVNIMAAGAAPLVASLTRRLNDSGIPFELKCFRDPHDYYRRDGLVLYADTRSSTSAACAVLGAVAALRDVVRDPTPILTERLAPGIARAPDPGAESYGQRCCRILAEAMLDLRGASAMRVADAAAAVERQD